MAWDEAVDLDRTRLDGGGLNPSFLVRDPRNGCRTIMPHQYVRVNTIFEVVRSHGGLTAWTDKHPSYEWTNGPSGRGVDDFYGPEINSIPVPLPGIPGCAAVPFPDPTPGRERRTLATDPVTGARGGYLDLLGTPGVGLAG